MAEIANAIDWTKSMQQTYEFYVVDPNTWKETKQLTTIKSCSIDWDADAETLGSASIDIVDMVGECYIRVYLIAIQNGIREKRPLGTFLVQTPSSKYDGKIRSVTMDAYTPLIELRENQPPLGYYIPKGENVMNIAYRLARENTRAPVVEASGDVESNYDFVADSSDTWLSFLSDFIGNQLYNTKRIEIKDPETGEIVEKTATPTVTKYKFALDEMGRILLTPEQDTASLQPVWAFNDDNSSILRPELTMDHDLYGIPNVVEVIYSSGNDHFYARVVNDDINSPVSTVNRGREIVYRVTDPDLVGSPTNDHIQEYAEQLLSSLSSPEYTITFTHGYCPVRIGDCVRLNYSRAGLSDIKAKIVTQSIKCEPGCQVTTKAVFTTKLWR